MAATTNSTQARERVRETHEDIVVGHSSLRTGEGRGRDGRRLSNYHRSKRDLKISMQICRIIIPTVRLASESYGGFLDLGLRHRALYIVFSVMVYSVRVRTGYRLMSFIEAESESEQTESKEPQGVLTVSSVRHLTSLNMDYNDGRDYTVATRCVRS